MLFNFVVSNFVEIWCVSDITLIISFHAYNSHVKYYHIGFKTKEVETLTDKN